MDFQIRKMNINDRDEVMGMMKEFYSSDAVSTNGSNEIFNTDIKTCINGSPYLEGYIFHNNNEIFGYAMIAKSFSTEFGRPCIWLEDLYLKSKYRGNGIISEFLHYIKQVYPSSIFKLEVEKENTHAIHVYKKSNFKELPYTEMLAVNVTKK